MSNSPGSYDNCNNIISLVSEFIKQKVTELQGEINTSLIIMADFYYTFLSNW